MNRGEDDEEGRGALARFAGRDADEPLSYVIELWTLGREGPERVIGRADNVTVAQAIFNAARNEHIGRRIVLRRGPRVIVQAD